MEPMMLRGRSVHFPPPHDSTSSYTSFQEQKKLPCNVPYMMSYNISGAHFFLGKTHVQDDVTHIFQVESCLVTARPLKFRVWPPSQDVIITTRMTLHVLSDRGFQPKGSFVMIASWEGGHIQNQPPQKKMSGQKIQVPKMKVMYQKQGCFGGWGFPYIKPYIHAGSIFGEDSSNFTCFFWVTIEGQLFFV